MIVRMDPDRGHGIETAQKPMQTTGPPDFTRREARTQRRIALRQLGKTIKERCQIKARAAGDDRNALAVGNVADHLSCVSSVFAGGVTLLRLEHVDHMVGNAAPFELAQFCGSDVEATIKLEGVAINNFAIELLGDAQRQRALPSSRGTDNSDE